MDLDRRRHGQLSPLPPAVGWTGDVGHYGGDFGPIFGIDHGFEKKAQAPSRRRVRRPPARAARRTSCGAASRSASARPRSVGNRSRSRRSEAPACCIDIALVDQLLEHAAQALLGDVEDVQEVGDAQARMAVDEMEHPVMGPAEAEIRQDRVRVAGEVAIGEEQQLGELLQLGFGQAPPLAAREPSPRLASAALPRARGAFRSVMLTYFLAWFMSAMLT